jgi:hypothetical protein
MDGSAKQRPERGQTTLEVCACCAEVVTAIISIAALLIALFK